MSLLLEALRSTETNVAAADEPLQEDETLDPRATLELLSPKKPADGALALAPPAPLEPAAQAAESQPVARAPAPAAMRREPAQASPNSRGTSPAPAGGPSTNKIALVIAALLVLAGVGFTAKRLWHRTGVALLPESSESAPPPASASPAAPVSLDSVQVAEVRPAGQFAYAGNAPEIDLHEAKPLSSAANRPTAATDASAAPEVPPHAARTPRAPTTAGISVSRSESESPVDRHIKAGYLALAAGHVAIATGEYRAALEIDENNVDALMGAAAAAARDGRSTEAVAAYARVLKLEPGNPDATAAIAMLTHDAGASESNESRLKILIAGDDGNRAALHAALAEVYAGDGRWGDAVQEYFTALAKDPGNPDLAFDVAASLDQNHNTAMALNFYQQALTFARQRPAQFDTGAVAKRISLLQARAAATHADAAGVPEAR